MRTINWGIIGCGDVTEVKSGPAFSKANGSALAAVMRRNAALAEDYARRHNVAKWHTDGAALINDPAVDAVYIATPPSSHEEYAIAALLAGKPVYLEKPMTTDAAAAKRIAQVASRQGVKLVVAHYRRQQPLFKKVKQLL
ncbi:MAG: Gfo/Idh/MocA family oxidoreductase [Sphingobacteriales bacterium]|nr:MAG: Gfo/Idh/MocA family oxidoreductase [Sphingobacteriales bacterium]